METCLDSLISQDFAPKTGIHFSAILLRPIGSWPFKGDRMGRLWNGIRALPRNRSSERLAHDEGGGPRSVGAAIIAGPLPHLDEPEPLV